MKIRPQLLPNPKLGSYQKKLKEKGGNYWKELAEKREKEIKESRASGSSKEEIVLQL